MEKYHIGQEILKEVKAKFPSVAAFARELCKSSSATYEIFGKTSLDTDLLLKVSKLLDRDFFREFSEKCLNGEVAVVDKQTAENSISLLLPEDKLHTVSPPPSKGCGGRISSDTSQKATRSVLQWGTQSQPTPFCMQKGRGDIWRRHGEKHKARTCRTDAF